MLSKNFRPSDHPLCIRATGCGLKVIDFIPDKEYCMSLYVSYNSISDLSNIVQFKQLSTLLIAYNDLRYIEDLFPLINLKFLSVIHLEGNPLCKLPLWRIYLMYISPRLNVINGEKVQDIFKKFKKSDFRFYIDIESNFYQYIINAKIVTKALNNNFGSKNILNKCNCIKRLYLKDPKFIIKYINKTRKKSCTTTTSKYFLFLINKTIKKSHNLLQSLIHQKYQTETLKILISQMQKCTNLKDFIPIVQNTFDSFLHTIGIDQSFTPISHNFTDLINSSIINSKTNGDKKVSDEIPNQYMKNNDNNNNDIIEDNLTPPENINSKDLSKMSQKFQINYDVKEHKSDYDKDDHLYNMSKNKLSKNSNVIKEIYIKKKEENESNQNNEYFVNNLTNQNDDNIFSKESIAAKKGKKKDKENISEVNIKMNKKEKIKSNEKNESINDFVSPNNKNNIKTAKNTKEQNELNEKKINLVNKNVTNINEQNESKGNNIGDTNSNERHNKSIESFAEFISKQLSINKKEQNETTGDSLINRKEQNELNKKNEYIINSKINKENNEDIKANDILKNVNELASNKKVQDEPNKENECINGIEKNDDTKMSKIKLDHKKNEINFPRNFESNQINKEKSNENQIQNDSSIIISNDEQKEEGISLNDKKIVFNNKSIYSTDEKFFASRGESLVESDLTTSIPIFYVNPSQSSEFDDFKSEKELPKSILKFAYKNISTSDSSLDAKMNYKILPNFSQISKAFALWKYKYLMKNTQKQNKTLQKNFKSKNEFSYNIPTKISKEFKLSEIPQLIERNKLISQIERQKEINISLKKRLNQLKKESLREN